MKVLKSFTNFIFVQLKNHYFVKDYKAFKKNDETFFITNVR